MQRRWRTRTHRFQLCQTVRVPVLKLGLACYALASDSLQVRVNIETWMRRRMLRDNVTDNKGGLHRFLAVRYVQ